MSESNGSSKSSGWRDAFLVLLTAVVILTGGYAALGSKLVSPIDVQDKISQERRVLDERFKRIEDKVSDAKIKLDRLEAQISINAERVNSKLDQILKDTKK